jgi:hypothetical protein
VTVCPVPGFRKRRQFYSKVESYKNTFNQDEVFVIDKAEASKYQVSLYLIFFREQKSMIMKGFYNEMF